MQIKKCFPTRDDLPGTLDKRKSKKKEKINKIDELPRIEKPRSPKAMEADLASSLP